MTVLRSTSSGDIGIPPHARRPNPSAHHRPNDRNPQLVEAVYHQLRAIA